MIDSKGLMNWSMTTNFCFVNTVMIQLDLTFWSDSQVHGLFLFSNFVGVKVSVSFTHHVQTFPFWIDRHPF